MSDILENFILYLPRTTLNATWLEGIVAALWRRGMSLSATRARDEAQMPWDGVLDMPIFAPPDPRADVPELNRTEQYTSSIMEWNIRYRSLPSVLNEIAYKQIPISSNCISIHFILMTIPKSSPFPMSGR